MTTEWCGLRIAGNATEGSTASSAERLLSSTDTGTSKPAARATSSIPVLSPPRRKVSGEGSGTATDGGMKSGCMSTAVADASDTGSSTSMRCRTVAMPTSAAYEAGANSADERTMARRTPRDTLAKVCAPGPTAQTSWPAATSERAAANAARESPSVIRMRAGAAPCRGVTRARRANAGAPPR